MADLEEARATMSERALQETVLESMRWMGWKCYHTHDSRRSNPGYPDVTGVKGTRLVFVEFKSEKGKFRPDQPGWLTALADATGEVYVVRPSTMDVFIDNLSDPVGLLPVHWHNQKEYQT